MFSRISDYFKYVDSNEIILEALKIQEIESYIEYHAPELLQDNSFLIEACKVLKERNGDDVEKFKKSLYRLGFEDKITKDEEFFTRFCKEVDLLMGINETSNSKDVERILSVDTNILRKAEELLVNEDVLLDAIRRGENFTDLMLIINEPLITNTFFEKAINCVENFSDLSNIYLIGEREYCREKSEDLINIFKESIKTILEEKYDYDFTDKTPNINKLCEIYESTVPKEEQMSLLNESLHREIEKQNDNGLNI